MIPASDHQHRLEQRLAELLGVERSRLLADLTAVGGKDLADQADRTTLRFDLAQVDARIQRLRDQLAGQDAAGPPAGDEDAIPRGARLVLDFGTGPETYRFGGVEMGDGLDVVTPDSPLGQALIGAVAGQRVTYVTPRGEAVVTLVSVGVPASA